jgi:hypothetical protein
VVTSQLVTAVLSWWRVIETIAAPTFRIMQKKSRPDIGRLEDRVDLGFPLEAHCVTTNFRLLFKGSLGLLTVT